ncbi:MAG: type VI secretion system tube protein Hcp [Hyphomonas sp.]
MSQVIAKSRRLIGATAASLIFAGLAHAGIEIDVGGTKIPATSLSFSVSQQPVYDPETYVPVDPKRSELYTGSFYVTRSFDGSSVKVLKNVIDGKQIPAVQIVMTRDGVPGRQVWKLKNATLNNYSTYTGEGSDVVENFDISYETATLEVYTGTGNAPSDTLTWSAAAPTSGMPMPVDH